MPVNTLPKIVISEYNESATHTGLSEPANMDERIALFRDWMTEDEWSLSHKSLGVDVDSPLVKRLQAANFFVQRTLVLGSSNRISDRERTSGFSTIAVQQAVEGHYQQALTLESRDGSAWQKVYTKQTEDISLMFKDKFPYKYYKKHYSLLFKSQAALDGLGHAIAAEIKHAGNCGARTYLAIKYLWENHQSIERLEYIGMRKFDHAILLVNRKIDSDPNDPKTWGEDCYCLDSWYKQGIVFKGQDFFTVMEKIYAYVRYQAMHVFALKEMPAPETVSPYTFDTALDISPKVTPYPRASQFQTVVTDWHIILGKTQKAAERHLKDIHDHRRKHEKAYQRTLIAIKAQRHTLFQKLKHERPVAGATAESSLVLET